MTPGKGHIDSEGGLNPQVDSHWSKKNEPTLWL